MKSLAFIVTALALAPLSVQAQEATQEFVRKATVSDLFELASSKLALERTQNPDVRQFAQHMIEDHGKAAKDLSAAVKQSESTAALPETLDAKHADMVQELGETDGEDFDRKHVEMQIAAHDEAVRLFESYLDSDDASPLVRRFAEKTLPVLKEHDMQIEQVSQKYTADL